MNHDFTHSNNCYPLRVDLVWGVQDAGAIQVAAKKAI
jgi:hypothetical protein